MRGSAGLRYVTVYLAICGGRRCALCPLGRCHDSRYTFPRRRILTFSLFISCTARTCCVLHSLVAAGKGNVLHCFRHVCACLPPRGSRLTSPCLVYHVAISLGAVSENRFNDPSCVNTVAISAARCYSDHSQADRQSHFQVQRSDLYVMAHNKFGFMAYAKCDATTPVLLFLVSPDSSSLAVTYDLSLLLVDIISAAICRSG